MIHATKTGYEIKIGTRIYYTGDQANQEALGTIVSVNAPTAYSDLSFNIFTSDRREMRGISHLAFEAGIIEQPSLTFYPTVYAK